MNDFGVELSQFYNDNTLNIFSDASIDKNSGCFGVVAVIGDNIIDTRYRLISDTTSNNSEIKGIRSAIDIALKYRDKFQYINIFSDSLISINGLREYIYSWKYNEKTGLLYNSTRKPVANQSIFIEAKSMLNLLEESKSIISIYHQSGHVSNNYNSILKAGDCFKKYNHINGKIDLNLIRYISVLNNYVDHTSRSILKQNRKNTTYYTDALEFMYRGDLL